MSRKQPVAFLSYVQNDDKHEYGRISKLRERLEGELRLLTGVPFRIFQDRNDIEWGQQWEERINETINDVVFLIPIVTPSYFASPACRAEYDKFLIREKAIGQDNLILPVYYVDCNELLDKELQRADAIAASLAARQWADWRTLRFKDLASAEMSEAIHILGNKIKKSIEELASIINASQEHKVNLNDLIKKPLHRRVRKEVVTAIQTKPLPVEESLDFSKKPVVGALYTNSKIALKYNYIKERPYYAFTKDFDEIISPNELVDAEQIVGLGRLLAPKINGIRKLCSARIAKYRGLLDDFPKSCSITLLLDNSGSMRGDPIAFCAAWCAIFTEEICQANIPLEILGHTTRAWKGGMSREAWSLHEKPTEPGRLNDLRFVVYKTFEQTQNDAIPNMSLMLREGLLKENIDGEALLWAFDRSNLRKSKHKFIFVLTDGAPVDDSTMSVNDGRFLERHYLHTIRWIENQRKTTLVGIRLGHSVERYHLNAFSAKSLPALGDTMFEALSFAKGQVR